MSVAPAVEMPLGWDGEAAEARIDQSRLGFDKDTSAFTSGSTAPLADATPTGTSYLLSEHWGGIWYDAEKLPGNEEDDLMCWAAAASNILAWTGWGLVEGMTNADEVFARFQNHWTDEGGMMQFGWDWWFDGTNPSEGWSGWSQVDVPGGGFHLSEDFNAYFHSDGDTATALSTIDGYLHSGYGVTLGIYGPGGHAITVWGYNYDPDNPSNYLGLWITDSDDSAYLSDPPDRLRYYEVAYDSGRWYLQDYYGRDDWYIGVVQALAPRDPTPLEPNEIRGTVWEDANGDGQRQADENGLAGQTVYVDRNNNGQLDLGTATVVSADVPKAIPDLGIVTSTLDFNGTGTISDLNLTLDITHTFDADLTAYLISPSGTRVRLFQQIGSSGANFTGTILDDEADSPITSAAAPFSGRFRPEELLARFDGQEAHGVWTLEIRDSASLDTGTLNHWSLEISTDETWTETGIDGTYVLTGLQDGSYRVRHQADAGWTDTYPADGTHVISLEGQIAEQVDFMTTPSAAPSAVNLGTVDYRQILDLNPSTGDLWYSLQTTRQGYLTLETLPTAESVELALYDADGNRLALSTASIDGARIDWQVSAGETYQFSISGTATDVDLRLANLVRLSGSTAALYGTSGGDRLDFAAAAFHQVTINGVHYEFDAAAVTTFTYDGLGGDDTAALCTSVGDDTLTVSPGSALLTGANYSLQVNGARDVIAISSGGTDVALLYDSAGDDVVTGLPEYVEMTGSDFYSRVEGFDFVHNCGTAGGTDVAFFYDSAGNDSFTGRPEYSVLSGDTFYLRANQFEAVYAVARSGGTDKAYLFDAVGNDVLVVRPQYTKLTGQAYLNWAKSFEEVYVYGTSGGYDIAYSFDTAGDDVLTATPVEATFQTPEAFHYARRFELVVSFADAGGNDTAHLYDSAGNDTFTANLTLGHLTDRSGFTHAVFRYESVIAHATAGGDDVAFLYGSAGDDQLLAYPTNVTFSGPGFSRAAEAFEYVHAVASGGGNDVAHLYDSTGDDVFVVKPKWSQLSGNGFFYRAWQFDAVYGHAGSGGYDQCYFEDSAGDDHLAASGSQAALTYAAGNTVEVELFAWISANGTSGQNTKRVEAIDYVLETPGLWVDV